MALGIGIDVGAASVKVAGVRHSGGLGLEFYRHFTLDELGGGGDAMAVATAVAHRLEQDGVRARSAVLGVSGRDAIIRYSHLPPMPEWRLALLMQFEIEDAAERTGEPLSSDFRVLPSDGAGNLVLVALAKDARVKESVEAFEGARIEVAGAVPQPVANGDCFRYLGEEPDRCLTLVLDIGQTSTEIALVEEGELIFARSVALGGEAFTQRVQKVLGVSRDEAEEIKTRGMSPSGDDLDDMLRGPRGQLCSMVNASVEFARKQLKRRNLQVDRAVVSGGAARLPGLVDELGSVLGCPAEPFDPLADLGRSRADRASREAADAHGLEAATAMGLALSTILPGATRLDLLPLSVKEKLEFRHRTLWMYVSAAILAAAIFVSFVLSIWQYFGESGRKEELATIRGAVEQRLNNHEDRAEANDRREADLRALAGRARAGFHLSALIKTLGKATPAEISLSEASLVRDPTPGSFHFEFSGLADDAQGNGISAIRSFKKALGDDPLISRVTVSPSGEEGTFRRFTLTIVPAGNPAPPEKEEEG